MIKTLFKQKKNIFFILLILFGNSNTNAQTFSKKSKSKSISLRKAPKYPPLLKAQVSFYETSGNNFLDAEEKGFFIVNIKNEGRGKASKVVAQLSTVSGYGLIFPNSKYIGDIGPFTEKTVRIPISASFEIMSKFVRMNIIFTEQNNFFPDPQNISFETRSFMEPNLVILDGMDIDDGNNNGMIESGELASLTVGIQNIGSGGAKDVEIKVDVGKNVFFGGDSKKEFYFKTMPAGKMKKFTIDVYTNKIATDIPIFVTIKEHYGKFGKKKVPLDIQFKMRVPKIIETQVVGIEEKNQIILANGLGIDVDSNIPKINIENTDGIAVIIGNRDYENKDVPSVEFAIRDAYVFKEYLINMFGYRPGNIFYYSNASLSNMKVAFNQLKNTIKKGKSDVFVYYSGHGAPDPESKQGYFVPVDADPNFIVETGYSVKSLYDILNKTKPKSKTVIIDACFSGSSDQGKILKDISPVFIEIDSFILEGDNSLIYSSASGEQVSSWYRDKKHSLFTYYFLKALQGDADQNKDKKLSVLELEKYIDKNVPYMARRLNNRLQTPQLITAEKEKAKILIQY